MHNTPAIVRECKMIVCHGFESGAFIRDNMIYVVLWAIAYLPTVPFLPGLSRFFSSVALKKRDVPFFRISELLFYLFIFSSFYLIFFLKKEKETRSHTHWRIKVRALITKTPRSGVNFRYLIHDPVTCKAMFACIRFCVQDLRHMTSGGWCYTWRIWQMTHCQHLWASSSDFVDFVALILAKMEPKKDRYKKERRPISFRKENSIEFPCITSSRKGTQHAYFATFFDQIFQ